MTNVIRGRVAMSMRFLLFVSMVGVAPAALANVGEVDITFPYTPLGALGSPITGVSGTWHGLGTIKLDGWTYPFAKTTFSEFMVSADGFMTVGNGKQVCDCNASVGNDQACSYNDGCYYEPPYGGYEYCTFTPPFETCSENFGPNFSPGLIAPFYMFNSENSFGDTTPFLGTISYLQGGPAGAHYLIVDWDGVGVNDPIYNYCEQCPGCVGCLYGEDCYCDIPEGNFGFTHQFQAILFESGAAVFTYGSYPAWDDVVGDDEYEDPASSITGMYFPPPDGGMGITDAGEMLGPSKLFSGDQCMNYWEMYEEWCYPYDFETWSLVGSAYMGELNTPFLNAVPAPAPVVGPDGPVINMTVTIANTGQAKQAGGFPVDFYMVPKGLPPYSLPSSCAGQDTCIGDTCCLGGLTFSENIPENGTESQTQLAIALPSPLPPSGIYTVAAAIDPTNSTVNAQAPLLEVGVAAQTLEVGQDMTGQIDVTNFTAIQANEFSLPVVFTNLGLEPAISVPYNLSFIASDGTPTLICPGGAATCTNTGTVYGISALTSETVNQDITVPSDLPFGVYQLQLYIEPGVPTDLNPNNNTILGIQRIENGQDMTASIISVPFSIPTPTSFTVPVAFHNLGLQPATDIGWTMALVDAEGHSYPVGGNTVSVPGLTISDQPLTATVKQPLPSGSYTLQLSLATNGTNPTAADLDVNPNNNLILSATPIFVYAPDVDYAVGPGDLQLDGSAHAADGQVISVTRTIHNLQGAAPPCPYSYFLNPPSVTLKGDGVPVAILSPTGPTYLGTTPPFGPYGSPNASNTQSDQIVLPDGMPPGTYNLVLVLDPNNQVNDINPSNNDTFVQMNVSANPLQITSPSSLFAAILDTPYFYQLEEAGAGSVVSWALLAGSLPPGVSFNEMGEITGTPTKAGVFTFVVQLASQGATQVAVLNLPVAAGSGALSIEQSGTQLPTAIQGSSYLQQLYAQGGVPPYTWKGTIPPEFGMKLTPAGVLAGTPPEATGGPVQFTVIVTDSIGTQASATLTLEVIAPGGLTITTPFLAPAVVGVQYDQPVLASDGTVTGATFSWSLPAGTNLPNGITFQEIGNPAVADISGAPTQAGIFPLVINVSDNFGHSVTQQYILTVAEASIPVSTHQVLPVALIGQAYGGQLQATSMSTLSWRIFSGTLPPGLSLAPTGAISGTVPTGTATGTYAFSAAVTDANGAESVLALNIQVQNAPAQSSGCATGSGPVGAGLLLLAIAWLGRRRRQGLRGLGGSALAASLVLMSAPLALAQVPQPPCGTPPMPILGSIRFQDISSQLGYISLAAPTATGPSDVSQDAYSDYVGGTGGECDYYLCYVESGNGGDAVGPFSNPQKVGTITLPFPFGFSGIYADGGAFNPPFQVQVWANGLLTFDPSVSFNPLLYPLNPIPPDCQPEDEEFCTCCPESCSTYDTILPDAGALSDTFGGFPFSRQYSPPDSAPNALIAPWWGDLSVCPNLGSVGWLLTLDDNDLPMAVIQWSNVTATTPEKVTADECDGSGDVSSCENSMKVLNAPGSRPQFSFQVRLHANSSVDFVYGPSGNFDPNNDCFDNAIGNCDYISGIQSNLVFPASDNHPALLDYATQALDCSSTTGCLQSQFPAANTSVTFNDVFRSVGPDLQVVGLNPPLLIPQGGTFTVPVDMSNGGGTSSHGEGQVQFYFSAGGTTPQGGAFSLQAVPVLNYCTTAPFNATVTLPASTPQGGGHLIVEFIPGAESVDPNHSFASASVVVGPPQPELAAVGDLTFSPPDQVAGQDISISFTVQNVGQIDAPQTSYGVYLSLGGSISASGIQIYGAPLPPLAVGQSVVVSATIQLPLTLVSGEYFIGAIVDPANTFKVANLANSLAPGKKLLGVTSPGPVITTTSLQDAQASSPYSAQLVAGGGDGFYQWSLVAGALPGGLALSKTGLVTGQAETVGGSSFTVKVVDGVGHSATAGLSINVDPFQQVLSIETTTLPPGSTGQLYSFTIAAVGGVAPYLWALVPSSGSLPTGISLVSNGTLTGDPQYDGMSTFQVTVTDSLGATVTSPVYTLSIFAAGALAVGSTELPTGTLGSNYNGLLHPSGGTAPYKWQVISAFREPAYPGDPGAPLGSGLPAVESFGLEFYAEGQIEGIPTEVGVFALTVQVTDAETPPATATGLVLLTITAKANFSFETVQLPPATINQGYLTQLQTNAPSGDTVTFALLDSAQLGTSGAAQCMPPGLTFFGSDGQIQGVPLETGTYSCLVEATDTQGGVAETSFAITVSPAPAPSSGGCQSANGAPALAGLVLLALTRVRRRRRSEP